MRKWEKNIKSKVNRAEDGRKGIVNCYSLLVIGWKGMSHWNAEGGIWKAEGGRRRWGKAAEKPGDWTVEGLRQRA